MSNPLINGGYSDSIMYFTGAQTRIFIGDYELAEAVEISGSYSMDQKPHYGYNSHYFDAVSHGRSISQGQFSINYVSDGYLYALINAHAESQKGKQQKRESSATGSSVIQAKQTGVTPVNLNGQSYYQQTTGTQFTDDYNAALAALGRDDIEMLKKRYWASLNQQNPQSIRYEFTVPLQLWIKDFRLGYGIEDSDAHESKVFTNVFLTGQSVGRSVNGSVTVETYSFISRILI